VPGFAGRAPPVDGLALPVEVAGALGEGEALDETVTLGTPAAAPRDRARFAWCRCCTAKGGAWTTVGRPPPASGSDSGGASVPNVTIAGSATAAANATPATAAAATIARLLLTSSPCFADPLEDGIGVLSRQPKSRCVDCWP
jgi:hypothetical protein